MSTLVRGELQLAKAELQQSAKSAGTSARALRRRGRRGALRGGRAHRVRRPRPGDRAARLARRTHRRRGALRRRRRPCPRRQEEGRAGRAPRRAHRRERQARRRRASRKGPTMAASDQSRSVDQIESDLKATRTELEATVDELSLPSRRQGAGQAPGRPRPGGSSPSRSGAFARPRRTTAAVRPSRWSRPSLAVTLTVVGTDPASSRRRAMTAQTRPRTSTHGRRQRGEQHTEDTDASGKPESPDDMKKPAWRYVLRRTVREFSKDECTDLAAALTYYAVLALFPAAIALLSLLGLVGQSEQTVDDADLAPQGRRRGRCREHGRADPHVAEHRLRLGPALPRRPRLRAVVRVGLRQLVRSGDEPDLRGATRVARSGRCARRCCS